jgi:HD-GYP domain-containing protein (c-di-GMP phosphodiesterase class II)
MKKIPVSELIPGMTCTDHVYFGNSNVLVAAKVPIADADIQRLFRWGIKEVETEGELLPPTEGGTENLRSTLTGNVTDIYKDISANMELTNSSYQEMLESLRFVLTKAKGAKELDEGRLKTIFKTMMDEFSERKPLLLSHLLSKATHEYVVTHSLNVSILSALIGIYMGYDSEKLFLLVRAALLHNIGMTALPSDLIYQEEEMSAKDRMLIRTHPLHGYRMLKDDLKVEPAAANSALTHHEHWDGTGYPRGAKGTEIDEFSRVIGVADSFSAMIVDREYRKKFTSYDAMRQILSETGRKFDPLVVKAFVEAMSLYPIGTRVVLNNGCAGIVVESRDSAKLRPVLKLLVNEEGINISKRNALVDLKDEKGVFIVRVLADGEDVPPPPAKEG